MLFLLQHVKMSAVKQVDYITHIIALKSCCLKGVSQKLLINTIDISIEMGIGFYPPGKGKSIIHSSFCSSLVFSNVCEISTHVIAKYFTMSAI